MPRGNVLSLHSRTFLLLISFNRINYYTLFCLSWDTSFWPKSMVVCFLETECLTITLKEKKNICIFFSFRNSAFLMTLFISLLFTSSLPHVSCFLFHWFRILEILGRQLSWAKAGIKLDADFKDNGSEPWTATADLLLCLGLAWLLSFTVLSAPIKFYKIHTCIQ